MKLEVRPNAGVVALAAVGVLLTIVQASRAQPVQAPDVPVRGVVEDYEEVAVPLPAGKPSAQAQAYSPYAGRKYPTRVQWGDTHLHSANSASRQLERAHPGLAVELVPLMTTGDKILDVPLAKVGGKGLFTKEIEQALIEDRADLAVHS